MKKHNLLKYFALTILIISSCSDLTDLNNDPNAASKVPAETLLTYSQFEFYDNLADITLNAEWGMLMPQYWSQNEYAEESRYVVTESTFNTPWQALYANVLEELEIASQNLLAEETIAQDLPKRDNKLALIKVMKAQVFAVLTDSFGDIPYSQALNVEEHPLPAYDSQEDVYKGILATLDEAYKMFDANAGSFDSGDIIYNGDVALWKKFTKSLMLKYAIRVYDKAPALSEKYAKIAATDLISSNADNATFKFGTAPDRSNPLWRNLVIRNRDDYCVSEFLVETLKGKSDPRLEKYAAPLKNGTIKGMPYGLTDNEATLLKKVTSRPNASVREAQTPFNILTYAEVQFLLAEAYQNSILVGNAADSYAKAIEASMQQWGITDATSISNYIAANPYNAATWKKSIGEEKWTALYMNGLEAWSEWRRLDYPVLEVPVAAVVKTIPVKLPYPISEIQNNNNNLSKVTASPTSITTKVWWDAN